MIDPDGMDYDAALADLKRRIPSGIGPDIERITDLAEVLGDPQIAYPSLHITGTNGKTSVARMVTSLFGALGIQVGTYTSPHLQDIRERLRIAGRPISEEDFAGVYEVLAPIAELVDGRHDRDLTYFEMLTAMAYWWFADYPVDVGIFEVGMGGAWDATNLVRGDVAVLNTVAVDHPELGATPGEVAVEKAGIIKPGAVVVTARQPRDAADVIERTAKEQDARVLRAGVRVPGEPAPDVVVEQRTIAVGGQQLVIRTPTNRYTEVFVPLHGAHQAENAAVAVGALEGFLGGLSDVDVELVREGFGAVSVPGRLEVVQRDPTIVLDGAHNPSGAQRTSDAIDEAFAFRDVILVAACLADKDVPGILRAFRDVASHVVVTSAPSERGADVAVMRDAASDVWAGSGVVIEVADDVGEALEKARGIAGDTDGVLVTGSLYTVGAARDVLAPFDEDVA